MFLLKNVLYVVGIPIGNIFDFSSRAVFILKNVDFIIAEDSRKIGFIMSFLCFKNKVVVLNALNEKKICIDLLEKINNGFSSAILSDCGTPGISDPGHFLIKNAYLNGIKVVPIPGSSIVSTVVSVCTFDVAKFFFEGFLPKKKIYKKIFFNKIFYENHVCIFFETGERLIETFLLIKEVFVLGRRIFVAKDLTKKFEYMFSFDVKDFHINYFNYDKFFYKGEFVILLDSFKNNKLIEHIFDEVCIRNFFAKDLFFKSVIFSSVFSFRNLLFLFF